jgi:hypothetical protein
MPAWGGRSWRRCIVAVGEVRIASITGLPLDDLLTAVDIEGSRR